MKKIAAALFSLMLLFSISTIAFAHSGRTDAKGGHYDHIGGDYHYHHGYPAHQHPNGECPYRNNSSSVKSELTSDDVSSILLISSIIGLMIGSPLVLVLDKIKCQKWQDFLKKHTAFIMILNSVVCATVAFLIIYSLAAR